MVAYFYLEQNLHRIRFYSWKKCSKDNTPLGPSSHFSVVFVVLKIELSQVEKTTKRHLGSCCYFIHPYLNYSYSLEFLLLESINSWACCILSFDLFSQFHPQILLVPGYICAFQSIILLVLCLLLHPSGIQVDTRKQISTHSSSALSSLLLNGTPQDLFHTSMVVLSTDNQ